MAHTDVYEELESALQLVEMAVTNQRNGDHMGLLRCAGSAHKHLMEAVAATVQKAYDDGATKKAMADAIDCPPSVFRGMKRTQERDGLDGLRAMLP
jgi:hypothetical protein